jgi:hypothetical protein
MRARMMVERVPPTAPPRIVDLSFGQVADGTGGEGVWLEEGGFVWFEDDGKEEEEGGSGDGEEGGEGGSWSAPRDVVLNLGTVVAVLEQQLLRSVEARQQYVP